MRTNRPNEKKRVEQQTQTQTHTQGYNFIGGSDRPEEVKGEKKEK